MTAYKMPRLTHWGRDKIAVFSQTTLSNAFSWMKMLEFRLRFHWSLAPTRRQAIIWNNDGHFTDAYTRHSVSMSWFTFLPTVLSWQEFLFDQWFVGWTGIILCMVNMSHWYIWNAPYNIDHSGYGLSQRETWLQRNVVSHWMSPYSEWSLGTWYLGNTFTWYWPH